MILQEAIKITQSLLDAPYDPWDEGMEQALKLLIEAGKLVEGLREGVPRRTIRLLPGETKE